MPQIRIFGKRFEGEFNANPQFLGKSKQVFFCPL
jgi:hypothetical protein